MPFLHLKPKVKTILSNENEPTAQRLKEVCELLQTSVGYYDWVGFYFANEAERTLHLKAFAGEPTDHTVIPFGKGICGQVAVSNKNFVVPDVKAQDNYIACSITVKSEIVKLKDLGKTSNCCCERQPHQSIQKRQKRFPDENFG